MSESSKSEAAMMFLEMMLKEGIDDAFLGQLAEYEQDYVRLDLIYSIGFVLPFSSLLANIA
jgi:hypothetical protein